MDPSRVTGYDPSLILLQCIQYNPVHVSLGKKTLLYETKMHRSSSGFSQLQKEYNETLKKKNTHTIIQNILQFISKAKEASQIDFTSRNVMVTFRGERGAEFDVSESKVRGRFR